MHTTLLRFLRRVVNASNDTIHVLRTNCLIWAHRVLVDVLNQLLSDDHSPSDPSPPIFALLATVTDIHS